MNIEQTKRAALKKTPLPWETLQCGDAVQGANLCDSVVTFKSPNTFKLANSSMIMVHRDFVNLSKRDPDGSWRPLWTETSGEDRIMETIEL